MTIYSNLLPMYGERVEKSPFSPSPFSPCERILEN